MTTKLLSEIKRLACDGWCDAEIARRLGIRAAVARKWRAKSGLPRGKKGMLYKRKVYSVYNGKTSQFLFEGHTDEIAQFLGLSTKSIYCCICRCKSGKNKKYEFYEVEE